MNDLNKQYGIDISKQIEKQFVEALRKEINKTIIEELFNLGTRSKRMDKINKIFKDYHKIKTKTKIKNILK